VKDTDGGVAEDEEVQEDGRQEAGYLPEVWLQVRPILRQDVRLHGLSIARPVLHGEVPEVRARVPIALREVEGARA